MLNKNKAIIAGRLGQAPNVYTFTDGGVSANLSVATSKRWRDKNNEWQENTEWHSVTINNKNLVNNVVIPSIFKGTAVYIEGEIRTRSYKDKDGIQKYKTEIIVNGPKDELKILSPRDTQNSQPPEQHSSAGFEDEIPY